MALPAGTRLGSYEILAPIGAGGMGEVYKAHDPRMGRDVAIKVSPEQFSERFSREVHAAAALNHPNICTVFDVGPNYLVMELIEGPTLAERIKPGALPLEEALGIAKQIADAVEAAHEKSIVHRDLKPGNIKIKPDGTVKVLDFGLAKTDFASAPNSDDSPTVSLTATRPGVILGTAAYMAPEQVRGGAVDRRVDVWAFGVIVYEMVTGKRLFAGDTVSDTLAAVLKSEPDLAQAPGKVRLLLRACLEKSPRQRLQAIGDYRLLVQDFPETAPARTKWLWPATAALLLVALLTVLMIGSRKNTEENATVRFSEAPPGKLVMIGAPVPSPDGRHLLFVTQGAGNLFTLWIRTVNLTARQYGVIDAVRGTLAWSPDSRFVVASKGSQLWRFDRLSGASQKICDMDAADAGVAWGKDGTLVIAIRGKGLMQVPAGGGVPRLLLADQGISSRPSFLPDGRHVLYSSAGAGPGIRSVAVESAETRLLVPGTATVPMYSAGYLLFRRDGALFAQKFDPAKLELAGEASLLFDASSFGASDNGVLTYESEETPTEIVGLDRNGHESGKVTPPGRYGEVELSPDGKQLLFSKAERGSGDVLWIQDLQRGVISRLTFDPAINHAAAWSPDGKRVVFESHRNNTLDLYAGPVDGSAPDHLFLKWGHPVGTCDWTPDGKYVLFFSTDPATKNDLWLMRADGAGKPVPLVHSEYNEECGSFSADGRFLAYASDLTGKTEVFIQPMAGTAVAGGRWQISKNGGTSPHWKKDGSELYYLSPENVLMAVAINNRGNVIESGPPQALFEMRFRPGFGSRGYSVSGDGQRFFNVAPLADATAGATVVLNWPGLLKNR